MRRRSTRKKVVKSISVLPEELLIEILLRLPIPTLLRCKSVSKEWLRLICSQYFIQTQLDHAIINNPRIVFTIRPMKMYTPIGMPLCNLFSLEYETSYCDMTCYKTEFLRDYIISGSCNGLVCLCGDSSVVLCNPATREYIQVQDHLFVNWHFPRGFGHDPLSNTYKLVKIIYSKPSSVSQFPDYEVYVYKFGTKKWRRISTSRIPFCLGNLEEIGLCLNGVVHWRSSSTTSMDEQNFDSIVGFDVGMEEFRQIPWIPTSTANQRSDCIGEIQGCLSLISTSYDDDTTDIWYMKDYGVQESWTKLYSLSPSYDSLEFLKKTETFISATSEYEYMYTYNRTNNTVHQYAIDRDIGNRVHAYVESLVSIASLNVGKRQSQRNRRPPDRLNL